MSDPPPALAGARSMTGFGRAELAVAGARYALEARALNSKGLDLRCSLPAEWPPLEHVAREVVQARLARGKVEVRVTLLAGAAGGGGGALGGAGGVAVDLALARELFAAHEALVDLTARLSAEAGGRAAPQAPLTARDLLALPGVLTRAAEPAARAPLAREEAEGPFREALAAACGEARRMREEEGRALCAALGAHLDELERLTGLLEARAPALAAERAARLRERLAELLAAHAAAAGAAPLDPHEPRLLTELALMAERADIHEELTRLRAHVAHLRALLASGAPEGVGRRCDFLCQELLREANTATSKVSDLEVTRLAVDLKAEIERLREQVQNVE